MLRGHTTQTTILTVTRTRDISLLLDRLEAADSLASGAQLLSAWARELTGCQAAIVRMVESDASGDWAAICGYQGCDTRFVRDETLISTEACLCGQVLQGVQGGLARTGALVCPGLSRFARSLTPAGLGQLRGRCLEEGYESLAIFPLTRGEVTVGCLHVADERSDWFGRFADALEAACRAAGGELDRLRHQEQSQTVPRVILEALFPSDPPSIPGLAMGASFRSTPDLTTVGGDFYDAIETGRDVLLLVGDYSGKGLEAAGMAAEARRIVAGIAEEQPEPALLLEQANDRLAQTLGEDRFVSLAVCRLDPATGHARLALAGHPWPLLLHRDKATDARWITELVLPPSPPLGLFPGHGFSEIETCLSEDDVMLLFTDGVCDSRSRGHFFGTEGIEMVWKRSGPCDMGAPRPGDLPSELRVPPCGPATRRPPRPCGEPDRDRGR